MFNSIAPSTRRNFLLSGTAIVGLAIAGGLAITPNSGLASHEKITRTPLNIPTEITGNTTDGVRSYDLSVQTGETIFFEGLKTDTMGINGSFLGPVLRLRAGDDIRINVANTLKKATTLHWHGFNLPAKADGGPHQMIAPGETWSPEFTVREKASTMWYHSHLMHKTAPQVWAGLAGMILIDDDESDALNLPSAYGVDDIPVILQDRSFRANGAMPYEPGMHFTMMGMTGEYPMVNGSIAPYLDVTTGLVRLRLLNGSNGSIYNLGFDDDRVFQQIASDGGLLAAPVSMTALLLAPGERAEIVVAMDPNSKTILRSSASSSGGGMGMGGEGGSPEFNFLELRAGTSLSSSPALPAKLANVPEISADEATNTRSFVLEMPSMGPGMMMAMSTGTGFTVNGDSMDMKIINEVVKRGETEIWEISNNSMMRHPFHIHNTQYRILDRDGRAPHAGEAGRKDTVIVNPGETVRVLIRFDHYTDPDTPYMYHCHILEHEDAGMMGQFTVV